MYHPKLLKTALKILEGWERQDAYDGDGPLLHAKCPECGREMDVILEKPQIRGTGPEILGT